MFKTLLCYAKWKYTFCTHSTIDTVHISIVCMCLYVLLNHTDSLDLCSIYTQTHSHNLLILLFTNTLHTYFSTHSLTHPTTQTYHSYLDHQIIQILTGIHSHTTQRLQRCNLSYPWSHSSLTGWISLTASFIPTSALPCTRLGSNLCTVLYR